MVVRLYSYQFPLTHGYGHVREGLILEWNEGWGEIAPLPGFSRETLVEAKAEITSLLSKLDTAQPKCPSVRFGIDCAKNRFSLEPIEIPLSALGPRPGFKTAKLKLSHLPIEEAISLTQKHYKNYRLRIDCNRNWSLKDALRFASHFSPHDFEYLEEPLQTFSELVQFSEITQFPIAVDESLLDSPWREVPTLKAVVVKPTIVGFIPQIPPHLDLILSSSIESGLGLLHIARLAQSSLPMGLDTLRFFKDNLLTSPIRSEGGIFSWYPSPQPPIDISKLCLIASVL